MIPEGKFSTGKRCTNAVQKCPSESVYGSVCSRQAPGPDLPRQWPLLPNLPWGTAIVRSSPGLLLDQLLALHCGVLAVLGRENQSDKLACWLLGGGGGRSPQSSLPECPKASTSPSLPWGPGLVQSKQPGDLSPRGGGILRSGCELP